LSREKAYELVQRNAMRVWDEGSDFLTLVKSDSDISGVLSEAEIEQVFSLDHYLRSVGKVFARVFV
jgi:adenylosuccinate lyase